MTITFYPTVGLRSNICTCFWRPLSLGLLSNHNSVTRRSIQPDLSIGLKWALCFIRRWIALKCLHEFLEAVFLGLLSNRYSVTRRYGGPELSNGSRHI
jgi:hypothetical protein